MQKSPVIGGFFLSEKDEINYFFASVDLLVDVTTDFSTGFGASSFCIGSILSQVRTVTFSSLLSFVVTTYVVFFSFQKSFFNVASVVVLPSALVIFIFSGGFFVISIISSMLFFAQSSVTVLSFMSLSSSLNVNFFCVSVGVLDPVFTVFTFPALGSSSNLVSVIT